VGNSSQLGGAFDDGLARVAGLEGRQFIGTFGDKRAGRVQQLSAGGCSHVGPVAELGRTPGGTHGPVHVRRATAWKICSSRSVERVFGGEPVATFGLDEATVNGDLEAVSHGSFGLGTDKIERPSQVTGCGIA